MTRQRTREAPPLMEHDGDRAATAIAWPDTMPRDSVQLPIAVLPDAAGMRLDKFLVAQMPRLSRSRASKIAARFAFSSDGTQLSPAKIVRAGDVIVLYRPTFDEPDVPRNVAVLYEDEHLVIVDKPAGLPVHPTARFHRNTLTSVLNERYEGERVVLCHRLDKDTSGIVVAARTHESERVLKARFASREVEKKYLALTHGEWSRDTQSIDAALALSGGDVSVMMAVRSEAEGGLPSQTDVRVCERLGGFTLVEAMPKTGRQHQIRIHLAHVGHPIVGDKLYAHGPEPFLLSLRDGLDETWRARLLLERHALHAHAIAFEHPATRRALEVVAELADDMAQFVRVHRAVNGANE